MARGEKTQHTTDCTTVSPPPSPSHRRDHRSRSTLPAASLRMIVGAGGYGRTGGLSGWWGTWVRARRAARRSRNRRKSIERSARRLARRGGLGELCARPDWSAASLYPVPRVQPVPRRDGRRRRSAAAVSDDRSGVCSERTVTIAPASTRTTYAHAHQLSRAQKISVTSSTTTHVRHVRSTTGPLASAVAHEDT